MVLELTPFVLRPGVGENGRRVRVRSNFFEVTTFPNHNLHHYDVSIDPANCPPAVYRKVWKAFEESQSRGVLRDIKTVYDGRKNIFSPKLIDLGPDDARAFQVREMFFCFHMGLFQAGRQRSSPGIFFVHRWNCKKTTVLPL